MYQESGDDGTIKDEERITQGIRIVTGLIINEGDRNDPASILLATKGGNYIRNARRPELPPERMKEARALWVKEFPSIQSRSLSATYNCYGLVFAHRRTHILGDGKDVEFILREDGYVPVKSRADVGLGDVVVYRQHSRKEITHAGYIAAVDRRVDVGEIDFLVMSQWGSDGEYLHKEQDVPTMYGQVREYYTERKLTYSS